jgi:hypothetical protein
VTDREDKKKKNMTDKEEEKENQKCVSETT